MDVHVKQEILETLRIPAPKRKSEDFSREPVSVIELSSSSESDSDDDSDDSDGEENENGEAHYAFSGGGDGKRARVSGDGLVKKKRKLDELGVVLPVGFLGSLPPEEPTPLPAAPVRIPEKEVAVVEPSGLPANAIVSCKQFWKAGDYEGGPCGDWDFSSGGLDHVRVHPKFLHSNATSHKWALGAFAELLDNSLDEVCNGATYVNIDMVESRKDGSRMLLIEDNGGGMDPDKMRQCMSLGYSAKSKIANTIGQYGNGFKTSTMRLGADVIVFSRCCGKDEKSPTESIGLLSYTFLRSTGKEDIVVPMLDYERRGREWNRLIRSSLGDWNRNVDTIVQWSPFSSEADLLRQFNLMKDHGTRIIIYNLWEDDQGLLELDFDADSHDIQLRGVNRDEKNIQMAREYPNSRHFLTYRHSLRSYASILYLRLPPSFRIILRGKDVEHHNIVNDMMLTDMVKYRPQPGADGVLKDWNMSADVTIGFVKDAKFHIDVQGFNVYHKNRLIKPFWRIWNAAGSDGRGVIGVLEANFVEPAHDKQGFERTTALARLEARLIQMQKNYWCSKCHKIGYAPRRNKKQISESANGGTSPDYQQNLSTKKSTPTSRKTPISGDKLFPRPNEKQGGKGFESFSKAVSGGYGNGLSSSKGSNRTKTSTQSGRRGNSSEPSLPHVEDVSDDDVQPERQANGTSQKTSSARESFGKDGSYMTRSVSYLADTESPSGGRTVGPVTRLQSKGSEHSLSDSDLRTLDQLKQENHELRRRLERNGGELLQELQQELQCERDWCKSLKAELEAAKQKIDELNKEQESLIDIFSEERDRRDKEEENLRKKLKDASNTIQELLEKVKLLERMKSPKHKQER